MFSTTDPLWREWFIRRATVVTSTPSPSTSLRFFHDRQTIIFLHRIERTEIWPKDPHVYRFSFDDVRPFTNVQHEYLWNRPTGHTWPTPTRTRHTFLDVTTCVTQLTLPRFTTLPTSICFRLSTSWHVGRVQGFRTTVRLLTTVGEDPTQSSSSHRRGTINPPVKIS